MEDARTTKIETRSIFEDARMMMEDAWMTVETAGILTMADEKNHTVKRSIQDSMLSMLS